MALKLDKVAYPPREGVVILVLDLLVDEPLNAGVWWTKGEYLSLRIAAFWELPQPLASIFHSTTMLGMEMPGFAAEQREIHHELARSPCIGPEGKEI